MTMAEVRPQATPPRTDIQIRVRFLGSFAVSVDGCPIERWSAGKSRSLFQILASRQGRVMSRESLLEALWPDSVNTLGSSLNVAVHGARRALAGDVREGKAIIERIDFGYRLAVRVMSDTDELTRLVSRGMSALGAGEEDVARELLEAAVALYQGDFLSGDESGWIIAERQHYRNLAFSALTALRDLAAEHGDALAFAAWCRRLLDLDMHHESTYRALMRFHAIRCEWAAVQQWFDLCVRLLREDLGVEPSRTTLLLHKTVMGTSKKASFAA